MERYLQEGGFVAVTWAHFTTSRIPGWSSCKLLGPCQPCEPPILAGILSMDLAALCISRVTW